MAEHTVNPDVWGDYTAIVNDGMKPGERAKQRDTTGSTVSANVSKIKRWIADGDTVNVSGSGTVATATDAPSTDAPVDPIAVASDMNASFGAIIAKQHVTYSTERDRAVADVKRATDKLDSVTALFDGLAELSEKAGFDYPAFVSAITPAPSSDDASSDDAPSDDAPSDDAPSDNAS